MTKLDVLDELDEIKMCINMNLNGKKIDYLPASVEDQLKINQFIKLLGDGKNLQMELKILMNYQKRLKIIFMLLKILLEQKFQAYLQVQKEMIQY